VLSLPPKNGEAPAPRSGQRPFDSYAPPDEAAPRNAGRAVPTPSLCVKDPTPAGELAAAAMAARNIPATDNQVRRDFVARFLNTLHDLLWRSMVEKIGKGRGVRWWH
jgi:hypothetical protein